MSLLTFGSTTFAADLVVFDKDGTLTDFESLWGQLNLAWMERLNGQSGGASVFREFAGLMGYDYEGQRTLPESPLVLASNEQLQAIAAAVLYRRGIAWPEAQQQVAATFEETVVAEPLDRFIRPLGDVAGVIGRLADAGVLLAVVTVDERSRTAGVLRLLGIADSIGAMACGDDGLPSKPAPDMLLAICDRLEVDPARVAVVGDTLSDMQMARAGGAGLAVAVLTGMGDPAQLATNADVVLESIEQIAVAP